MHRSHILSDLSRYQELWAQATPHATPYESGRELATLDRMVGFVKRCDGAFERSTLEGHLTGSALVVSRDLNHVLLTLHGKLGKWLQLGGHADGHNLLHEVAMREAEEESGLTGLSFLDFESVLMPSVPAHVRPLPLDLDCHDIPERPGEPRHVHYDVRYVIVADRAQPLVISEESKDLRWFDLAEARVVAPEASTLRQFDKLNWLRERLISRGQVVDTGRGSLNLDSDLRP